MTVPNPKPQNGATLSRLLHDAAGLAAIEFAIVGPVFLILLFGAFDAGQLVYGNALLNGATERAARDSSLETGDVAAADAYVERIVRPILSGVVVTTSRVNYFDFSDIDQPESFDDVNANGTCDENEIYSDENRNGEWDEDVGLEGNGGAGDVVVYSATATYRSAIATLLLPSSLHEITLRSQAVRKNQPFGNQVDQGSIAGLCT